MYYFKLHTTFPPPPLLIFALYLSNVLLFFHSFSTSKLNHSLCVCVFILSHMQWCVQLVLFLVVVCVLCVRVIHFKWKKVRCSVLPAPQEHPLRPREPSVLLTVSTGQAQHTNSRTAGVDGCSYTWQLCQNVDHRFQRQMSVKIIIFFMV